MQSSLPFFKSNLLKENAVARRYECEERRSIYPLARSFDAHIDVMIRFTCSRRRSNIHSYCRGFELSSGRGDSVVGLGSRVDTHKTGC
jgi:hypothetical protein